MPLRTNAAATQSIADQFVQGIFRGAGNLGGKSHGTACRQFAEQQFEHALALDQARGIGIDCGRTRNHHDELQRWLYGNGYQILRIAAEGLQAESLLEFLNAHQELGNQWCHPSHLLDRFGGQEGDVPPGSCQTPLDDFWGGLFFSPWQSQNEAWELSQQAILGLENVQDRLDELLTSTTFANATPEELGRLRQLVDWCQGL